MNETYEPTVIWEIPEGTYTAKLIEAGNYVQHRGHNSQEYFRLVFEIDNDNSSYEFRSQKRYTLKEGWQKRMRKDLEKWVGKDWLDQYPNLTWDDLLGFEAKITIKQRDYGTHRKPFSSVTHIKPVKPNRKTKTSQMPPLATMLAEAA